MKYYIERDGQFAVSTGTEVSWTNEFDDCTVFTDEDTAYAVSDQHQATVVSADDNESYTSVLGRIVRSKVAQHKMTHAMLTALIDEVKQLR